MVPRPCLWGSHGLNVYAGLFGNFFVRDSFEDNLNLPKGKYEIALTICDRSLDLAGQLYYPISPDPQSPWVPDCFGEAIRVKWEYLFPISIVEPRRVSLGSAYSMRPERKSKCILHFPMVREFHQIGTDLGLLPAPAKLKSLLIAPGERADLVLDFSGHAGEKMVVTNDSLTVMQFRVLKSGTPDTGTLPNALRPVPKIAESDAVKTRVLTLGEKDDKATNPVMMLLNNAHWDMPVTENPALNSIEDTELAELYR